MTSPQTKAIARFRTGVWVAAVLCLAGAAGAANELPSVENSTRGNADTANKVPSGVHDAFMAALGKTPQYQWAMALRPERVQRQVDDWQRELGVRLRVQTNEAWQWWLQSVQPLETTEGTFVLQAGWYFRHTAPMIVRIGEREVAYRVPQSLDGPFRFKFVSAVDVVDLSNVPIERYSVQNQDLATVVRDLCERGKLGYSFRQDASDKIRISLDIRNRSVVECLNAAAAAAGWKVSYSQGDKSSIFPMISDDRVFVPNLLGSLLESQQEAGPAGSTQATQPVPDALAALKKAVREAAEETLRVRPTAILQPEADKK